MDKITRKEAIEQGLTHYFTGKACKRGHVAKRFVKGQLCVDCAKFYQQRDRDLINSRRRKHETSIQEG